MNLVSLITFTAFIIYIFLAFFGLQMDFRSRLNRIFFGLCLACALWAFCIAFMFAATNHDMAWRWFRLSSPGWGLGPALVLHFALALTGRDQPGNKKLPVYLIYLPGLIFTVLGLTVGVTASQVTLMSFGWSPINSGNLRYWLFAVYYAAYIALSIIVVWQWGKNSPSRRQQKQARVVVFSTFLGTLLAFFNETLLPVWGYADIPKVPVVLWLIWAYGMWIAISRYRLLILTPAIAADQIVASITDMMVLLDLNFTILKVNRSVEEVLGYAENELSGKPVTLITATWNTNNKALYSLVAGVTGFCQEEAIWVTKLGVTIPVQISVSVVKDNYADLVCLVMVAQDLRPTKELEREISERRRAEQALQKTVLQIKDYSNLLEQQNRKLESQNAELEALTISLAETNQTLEEKNSQLENLFNNVGQGFLSFSRDLLIRPEYSYECLNIFRQNPTGKRLSNLIYPQDEKQAELMDTLFREIIQEPDQLRLEVFLSLLPEEVTLYERCISMAYRVVHDSPNNDGRNILVILTDISEKRFLEARVQEEKDIFGMVVKAIIYHDDLLECIEDFRNFCDYVFEEILFSSRGLDEILAEILRQIHTFKGNFSQFDTASVVGELHRLESLLLEARDQVTGFDRKYLLQILRQSQLLTCLEDDLNVIKKFMGDEVFNKKDTFVIDKEKLLDFEQAIYEILAPAEYQLVLPLLRSLRFRPFKELLKSYPEYVQKMAQRLDKQVYPFVIEGDDLLVDSDYYHQFARSLVHVFRNCVDHGLENAEARAIQGKEEIGTIRCSIQCKGNRILISISDDGPGIDLAALRQRAIDIGIYTPDEVNHCTEQQLLELIFFREFSTQTEVSLISGRGVGLSAVKVELENIGGRVTVSSHSQVGTEFLFDLPLSKP